MQTRIEIPRILNLASFYFLNNRGTLFIEDSESAMGAFYTG